jgi:DNA replication protein DnaC
VLFTLMAERYERRSLIITSNLVFAQWDRIFKTPMATAAAIPEELRTETRDETMNQATDRQE